MPQSTYQDFYQSPNYRQSKRTQYDLVTAATCIRQVLTPLVQTPTTQQIAKLLSQARFETAGFKYCWNHNWGNTKRMPTQGAFHMIRCNEIINGKLVWFDPPHPQCCFAANADMVSGATNWARLILTTNHYAKSRKLLLDDAVSAYDFVYQLGLDGYYTATREKYSRNVEALMMSSLRAIEGSQRVDERPAYRLAGEGEAFTGRRELHLTQPIMQGDDVGEWIDWLKKLNCYPMQSHNDAKFGPLCDRGTRQLQQESGLPVTGFTNPETVTAAKARLGLS